MELPAHEEAAVGERHDAGIAGRRKTQYGRIDQNVASHDLASVGQDRRPNISGTPVIGAFRIIPYDNKAATAQCGNIGLAFTCRVKSSGYDLVDRDRTAGVGEYPIPNVCIEGSVELVPIDRHEVAVGKPCKLRRKLIVGRVGVDCEQGAHHASRTHDPPVDIGIRSGVKLAR
jgi:hypothetical protein